ncbi:MAG: hypothetical protein HUN04_08405 [Desulfobacter sp.]|nr:MAG: hypothetical protein HUN04_08405 [Desulfobacter sp.]
MIAQKVLREKIEGAKDGLKVIIGAAAISYPNWIDTEQRDLNVVDEDNWLAYFRPGDIDNLLAEHVWEHIDPGEQKQATLNCFRFLKPGGVLRIAVPDGYRTDPIYQEEVLPPKDGHTMMFNYHSLSTLLEGCGFRVRLLEYFDETGVFHSYPWRVEDGGMIRRSLRHDTQERFFRFQGKYRMNYTSLIADGVKPV